MMGEQGDQVVGLYYLALLICLIVQSNGSISLLPFTLMSHVTLMVVRLDATFGVNHCMQVSARSRRRCFIKAIHWFRNKAALTE